MSSTGMIRSIIKEYGIDWGINRSLYSARLKMLRTLPVTESLLEKRTNYPKRLDLFRIDVDELKQFLADLANADKERLIIAADKACRGVITGFSSIELNYGNPIDWQMNPLTGRKCNGKLKWYRISDFDKDRGDIKVIWEASRFSYFITLARAYLLTENEKYYKAFSNQLFNWLKNNPYSFGANFKCGQECSLRMVNVLLAFTVFQNIGISTETDENNVKDLVDRCYRKVLSNFFYSYKCIKNNHTISELMGMVVGAWCCEEEKRLDKAIRLLNETVADQFTNDGGYRQFSFNYQRLALQDLEVILSIEDRIGRRLSDYSKEKIKNAAILMHQCQDESGDMPNYGSNDGALAFPVTSCGYRNFRAVINTSYALITGNQMNGAGKHQEELIWFSGGRKVSEFKMEKIERESSQFPDAGLFTLRSTEDSRDENSWCMMVLNDYHSRPAHMDQLHIDLWIDGVNVLCDSGTYSYASELGRKLIENRSHNTAVTDKTQMNLRQPFMIYGWTKRNMVRCDGREFEGKCIACDYTHIRRVWKNGVSFEIKDTVDKDYAIVFHTPCDVKIDEGTAILSQEGKILFRIKSNGEIISENVQRSLYYFERMPATCLIIKGKARTTIRTIIVGGLEYG